MGGRRTAGRETSYSEWGWGGRETSYSEWGVGGRRTAGRETEYVRCCEYIQVRGSAGISRGSLQVVTILHFTTKHTYTFKLHVHVKACCMLMLDIARQC